MTQTIGTSLANNLDEEQKAARQLLQLLKEEQAHLVKVNIEQLGRMTEEKAAMATHMSALAMRRYTTLAEAGFDASEAGMRAWIDQADAPAVVAEKWSVLLGIATRAKEENRVNGLLLGQHMTRTQSSLNVLQANTQGGSFYGPNGQSATKLGSRHLVVG